MHSTRQIAAKEVLIAAAVLDLARRGENHWWRYVLGTGIVLSVLPTPALIESTRLDSLFDLLTFVLAAGVLCLLFFRWSRNRKKAPETQIEFRDHN
jgi:hypothetical protein